MEENVVLIYTKWRGATQFQVHNQQIMGYLETYWEKCRIYHGS